MAITGNGLDDLPFYERDKKLTRIQTVVGLVWQPPRRSATTTKY
jgi:hypothetical protein